MPVVPAAPAPAPASGRAPLAAIEARPSARHAIDRSLIRQGGNEFLSFKLRLLGIHRKGLPALLFGLYSIAVTIHALFNLYVTYNAQGQAVGAVIPPFLFVALMFLYNFDLIEESNREKQSWRP